MYCDAQVAPPTQRYIEPAGERIRNYPACPARCTVKHLWASESPNSLGLYTKWL
jgi:hypothetical protein